MRARQALKVVILVISLKSISNLNDNSKYKINSFANQQQQSSFKILGLSSNTCTVHLLWNTINPVSLEIRDRIIRDNLGSVLFTFLNSYDRGILNETFHPFVNIRTSIEFFKECSIQILIESPDIDDEKRRWYFYYTRYPMGLEGRNNIMIIVRFIPEEIVVVEKRVNLFRLCLLNYSSIL